MTRRRLFLTMIFVAAATALVGGAALADGPKGGQHGTITTGNGFYDVSVQDVVATGGLGQYTARTADNHPITIATGHDQNVLFDGAVASPGTSYTTVRSYTSETDYVNAPALPASAFDVASLDSFATVEALGSTGVRSTYVLPGGQASADQLTIVEDVRVNGTTANNSTIEITTTVTNDGDQPVDIGVRYLWDWTIGDDDGPTFAPVQPNGSAISTEQTFTSPDFTAYAIADNNDVTSPLFVVYGTASGPSNIEPEPTTPDELMFASWPGSVGHAFDYTTNPTLDIATSGEVDDSAVLYYWGPDSDHPLTLAAGASVTVSASLFAGLPDEPPPVIDTPTPTVTAEAAVRHHRATATPTPTLTPTVAATTTTVASPAATATPSGGAGPAISPPATGGGPTDGRLPVLPGLVAGTLAAFALAGGLCLRARRQRR